MMLKVNHNIKSENLNQRLFKTTEKYILFAALRDDQAVTFTFSLHL